MYQFSLDKSSKKFVCPNCQKRTFVKYFDNLQNIYLDEDYGRCDRETNCKYHLVPNQHFTISEIKEPQAKLKASTINPDLLIQCSRNFKQNNLIQFLKIYFSIEEIQSVIQKYAIGTSAHWKGATVFWQINSQNQIRTGKVMLYDANSGSRVKKPFNHINWVHKLLKIEPFNLQQCLFGLHLKKEINNQNIAIVESEKTAIMMSLFLTDYIWMATGSKGNLKKDILQPIKNFNIVAYPDKSEFEDWNKKTQILQKEGFKITCSRFIENMDVPTGTDLADIYLEARKNNFNIPTQTKFSKAEIEVQRLAKINPEILNLISVFDLLDENHNPIVNTK